MSEHNDGQKITEARFETSWGRAILIATTEDGNDVRPFGWYIDELSFTESEFVGLTIPEACQLYHDRDVAYLRS